MRAAEVAQAVFAEAVAVAVHEVAVAVGTEIAGELGAKFALCVAQAVGKIAGASAAGIEIKGQIEFVFLSNNNLNFSCHWNSDWP